MCIFFVFETALIQLLTRTRTPPVFESAAGGGDDSDDEPLRVSKKARSSSSRTEVLSRSGFACGRVCGRDVVCACTLCSLREEQEAAATSTAEAATAAEEVVVAACRKIQSHFKRQQALPWDQLSTARMVPVLRGADHHHVPPRTCVALSVALGVQGRKPAVVERWEARRTPPRLPAFRREILRRRWQ